MNLHDWIDELSDVLDIEVEVDEALMDDVEVAVRENVGAHAPAVSVFLLGYAAATHGAGTEQVERLSTAAIALAEAWDRPHGARDPDDVDDEIPDDSSVDHSGDRYADA